MKPMTEKKIKPHLEALNLKLDGNEVRTKENASLYMCDIGGEVSPVRLADWDIELIKENPEITQENLCKFYLRFKDSENGGFPSCLFEDDKESYKSVLYCVVCFSMFIDHNRRSWPQCSITDSRWTKENLGASK